MGIEEKLREIVEKAKWEHSKSVWGDPNYKETDSTTLIVHALLTSEEVEVKERLKNERK